MENENSDKKKWSKPVLKTISIKKTKSGVQEPGNEDTTYFS